MSRENTPVRGTATYTSSGDQTAIVGGIADQYFYITDVIAASLAAPNYMQVKSGSDVLMGIGPEIVIVGAIGQFTNASLTTPIRCGLGEDVIIQTANANSITVTVLGYYSST